MLRVFTSSRWRLALYVLFALWLLAAIVLVPKVVSAVAPLNADFEASPREGSYEITVTFLNMTSGGVPPYTAATWDFGDGTIVEDQAMQPGETITHTYDHLGCYSPTLTIYDSAEPPNSSSEVKDAHYILVTDLELDSYFEAYPRQGEPPLTITFTNLTISFGCTLPYAAATWDFGDGTIVENQAMQYGETITHIYTQEGYYSPQLTITDSSTPPVTSVERKEFGYITIGEIYPGAPDEPATGDGFASITSYLETAYGYKQGEGVHGWTVYNPDWLNEANTLETLYMGRGYWVCVTDDCLLEYGSESYELNAGWNLIGWLGR